MAQKPKTNKTTEIVRSLSPEDQQSDDIKRVHKFLKGYTPDADAQPGFTARAPGYIDRKALRKAVPDADDKINIHEYIKTYNIAFPYPHPQSLQAALEEGIKGTIRDPKKVRKAKEGTPQLAMHLPLPFCIGLKKAYPFIFSAEAQFNWFLTNFPELSLKV